MGKLKGGGPKPIEHEKNRAVLDKLLPLLASKIDASGGVMRVSDLAFQRDIKFLLYQIPPRCPKSLPLIFAQWTDFFITMADGLVGTAMGYDTGMIEEDGSLSPLYQSNFTIHADPVEEPIIQIVREAKPMDLTDAADLLWRSTLNLGNDADFKAAFKAIETARKHVRSNEGLLPPSKQVQQNTNTVPAPRKKANYAGPLNIGDCERATRRQHILRRIVDILSQSPNQTKNMCLLVSDPTIRELKKGAVSKFLSFLQEFPRMLKIVQVEGIPQYNVTLLDSTIPDLREAARQACAPAETPAESEE